MQLAVSLISGVENILTLDNPPEGKSVQDVVTSLVDGPTDGWWIDDRGSAVRVDQVASIRVVTPPGKPPVVPHIA